MTSSEFRDLLSKISEAIGDKISAKPVELSFLLVGRSGVGKSSTINTLLGAEVAPTGKYRPTTLEVKKYRHSHNGVPYAVIDTPGLCDDLPEFGNDGKYLDLIKSQVEEINSLLYVTKLDDTRLGADERRGIKLVSSALGPQIWKRAVIVFTFADTVKPAEFAEAMSERTKIIREEIAKYAPAEGGGVPSVAVTNSGPVTPDGAEWLGELFTVVFERINDGGMLPFLVSMLDDLKPKKGSGKAAKPRIKLSKKQKDRVRKSLLESVIEGGTKGSAIGEKFGPWGIVIGGVLGMGGGALFHWLFEEEIKMGL